MSNKFKDTLFFLGKEVEGRKAGIKTLFVTCKFFEMLYTKDIEFDELVNAAVSNHVQNIYLGAAGAQWSRESLVCAISSLKTLSEDLAAYNFTSTIEIDAKSFSEVYGAQAVYLDNYADHILITVSAPALYHSDKYEVKVSHAEHCTVCVPYQKIDTRYIKDEVLGRVVQQPLSDTEAVPVGDAPQAFDTVVSVSTRFEATHCWPDCPLDEVSFLRTEHRHEFHVTVKAPVTHDDRDIEFIVLKRDLRKLCRDLFEGRFLTSMSCEMIAKKIIDAMNLNYEYKITYCSVYEDGENGAEVTVP